MSTRKFFMSGAAAAAGLVIGGVVAFAAWTAGGTGSGSAIAFVAKPVTLNAVALSNSAASLFPGGPAGSVYIQINNPNPYPVEITTVAWGTPTSNNPAACSNSVISIDANAPTTGLNWVIQANSTGPVTQILGVLDLSTAALDGCQGNGFSVPLTLSGVQLP